MNCIKKLVAYIFYFLLCFFALVLLYLGAAFILPRISVERELVTSLDVTVYIYTNRAHTDIVVPAKTSMMDWTQELKYEYTSVADFSFAWLGIGWGDRGFYLDTPTWGDLTSRVAVGAAFGLGTTATHATYDRQIVEGNDCVKIVLSSLQYMRLVQYIQHSFQTDAHGH